MFTKCYLGLDLNQTLLGGCSTGGFTNFSQKSGRKIRSCGFPATYRGYQRVDMVKSKGAATNKSGKLTTIKAKDEKRMESNYNRESVQFSLGSLSCRAFLWRRHCLAGGKHEFALWLRLFDAFYVSLAQAHSVADVYLMGYWSASCASKLLSIIKTKRNIKCLRFHCLPASIRSFLVITFSVCGHSDHDCSGGAPIIRQSFHSQLSLFACYGQK